MIRATIVTLVATLAIALTAHAEDKVPPPAAAVYVCSLTAHRICNRASCREGPTITETFRLDFEKKSSCAIVKGKCSGATEFALTSKRGVHRIAFAKAVAVMILHRDGTISASRLQRKSVIMSFGRCKPGRI